VIGLLTNFAGLLFLMSGLTCIDISTSKKIKMQIGAGMNLVAGACVLITFILFKINEWNTGSANMSSSLGKGMYLLIGCLICQVGAVVLAISGMESDEPEHEDYQSGAKMTGQSYI